jgi:hypothetical protein
VGALGVVASGTSSVVVGTSVVVDVEVVVDVDVVVVVEGAAVDVVVANVDSVVGAVVASPARSADAQLVSRAPATSVATMHTWTERGRGAPAAARSSPHVRCASRACALRPIAVVTGSCVMG